MSFLEGLHVGPPDQLACYSTTRMSGNSVCIEYISHHHTSQCGGEVFSYKCLHLSLQKSLLPRVVVVSGLPHHIPTQRLSSRLDRLSDNCGGKVLLVHPPSGTARVLFRTPEWAMK